VCSKGTYIRTLAADIGRELGCGAHLVGLRRLRNGLFSVTDSIPGGSLAERDTGRQLLLRSHIKVDEVEHLLHRQQATEKT
jgi:tRNA pseudouridine55 synthase